MVKKTTEKPKKELRIVKTEFIEIPPHERIKDIVKVLEESVEGLYNNIRILRDPKNKVLVKHLRVMLSDVAEGIYILGCAKLKEIKYIEDLKKKEEEYRRFYS